MKTLLINPQDHEFSFRAQFPESDLAEVDMKLGDVKGTTMLTAPDAERIGKWFVSLSKQLKKAKKASA